MGTILATGACGSQSTSQETTDRGVVAAQPTDESWLDYLVGQAEQNPTDDIGAQDLPKPSYDELLGDIRAQETPENALARQINQAHPTNPAWAQFTASSLNDFAYQVCFVNPPQAVRTLVRRLPGMVLRDAPLMDQAVRLIPQHCKVVQPKWVDYVSNVLFSEIVRNTLALSPDVQPSSTAAAPAPSASENLTEYRVVCAMGNVALGDYLKSRVENGTAKFLGLIGLAGAVVVCPDVLGWLFD
ncbi:hypothetical protein ACFYS7_36250 [Streptomyces avermitilis]|uniref:hypothetical protein n=1 Tax=Streptomyces avermitilis TaxID=33903 RepID=UPI0036BBB330